MAGSVVARAWQSIKPHVPLIRFRKGGLSASDSHASDVASPQHVASSAAGGKKRTVSTRPVIEDYQLPLRYRRQPIDQKEIDYINRGGPE